MREMFQSLKTQQREYIHANFHWSVIDCHPIMSFGFHFILESVSIDNKDTEYIKRISKLCPELITETMNVLVFHF